MFRINEVLAFNETLYRILIIFPEEIVWIPLYDDRAFPSIVSQKELMDAVDEGVLTRESDPFEFLTLENPDEESIAWGKREKNFALIQPIIIDHQAVFPNVRAARVKEVIEEKGSTKPTLYNLLRRYWQRGQNENAMLPDYKKSGAKGKKRQATDKKLGRPRIYTAGIGAIINEDIERLFRRAIEKYLLTEKKNTLSFSHRRFQDIYDMYYPNTPAEEIPTFWQMQHFYQREYKQVEIIQKRASSIAFAKDIRPLSSTANTDVLGPGSRFEIDATIADIYVVSNSERRNIIGRPVIYMVIDVFSRMVAGFYVGVESPSYASAMQALTHALTDKVDYCKKFGFDIEYEDWPVIGLPDAILADRGELLGHQIESLERSFSVRIENTPPYRGDAKGIVERSFKTHQAIFKPYAPGIVTGTKIKKQGDKDYRLDATLTINEFTEIILASVLYHNRFHTMKKYDRDIDMPTDLLMTPLSLWNWGLQNRTGKLRAVSEDAATIALLPRKKATISELGICLFGVYYTCSEIVLQGWMHRSKEAKHPKSLDAAYDPRTANHIYLFPEKNSSEYWVCDLTQRCREFDTCSFWDVWQTQNEQKKSVAASKLVSKTKERELERLIEEKIKQAKKEMPNTDDQSNVQRTKGIIKHRAEAKREERQQTAFYPEKIKQDKLADVIPLAVQEDDYSFPDHIDELFDED
ncbi:Mu transposase C-terminal domain-containing protein [Pseudoalteromonas denitrificans]|uniref:Mu transposase, C-terminal n=1 Tax=Pseudoalteromonas denitrificans DSM 6059 TaxID=1123010 RepID=A0A1I1JGM3_9GAMM|nr:Mu transposase C-terminal domain-containing protein [Pseudoalteromonas denitrificans]SFC47769.1 Mu transposase, C-terminal [Pseudoalteromonas denitrificans DSM 6059]